MSPEQELGRSPIFAAASVASRALILKACEPRMLAADEPLAAANSAASSVYWLVDGRLRVFHADGEANEATVRHLAAPSLVGAVESLAGTAFANNVEALVSSRVLAIDAGVFRRVLETDVGFTFELFRHTCRLFCVLARQEPFVLCDLERRLASFVVAYLTGFGREGTDGETIRYPLTQAILAHDLGANLRSVRRVLGEWSRKGWVSMRKGWMVVHAREQIEAASGRFRDNLIYFDGIRIADLGVDAPFALRSAGDDKAPEPHVLRENPVLAGLADDQLQRLLSRARCYALAPNTLTIRAGEESGFVDLLFEGQIRVFHRDEAGLEVTVKHLGAPCTLGEMQVLARLHFVENAETLTAARMLRVTAADFLELLAREHAVTLRLLLDVSARMCFAMRHEASVLFSVEARMASLFLAYAQSFGHVEDSGAVVLRFPLTRARVASELGVTVRSVARVLQEWRDARAVESDGDSLRISQLAALRAISGGLQYNLRYEASAVSHAVAEKRRVP